MQIKKHYICIDADVYALHDEAVSLIGNRVKPCQASLDELSSDFDDVCVPRGSLEPEKCSLLCSTGFQRYTSISSQYGPRRTIRTPHLRMRVEDHNPTDRPVLKERIHELESSAYG